MIPEKHLGQWEKKPAGKISPDPGGCGVVIKRFSARGIAAGTSRKRLPGAIRAATQADNRTFWGVDFGDLFFSIRSRLFRNT